MRSCAKKSSVTYSRTQRRKEPLNAKAQRSEDAKRIKIYLLQWILVLVLVLVLERVHWRGQQTTEHEHDYEHETDLKKGET